MKKEEWRFLESAPKYQISNKGRVKGPRKILTPSQNQYGYWLVCTNSIPKSRYIHRLVAEAFVHNDDPLFKTEVHHINGDNQDNRPENLKWTSSSKHFWFHMDIDSYCDHIVQKINAMPSPIRSIAKNKILELLT